MMRRVESVLFFTLLLFSLVASGHAEEQLVGPWLRGDGELSPTEEQEGMIVDQIKHGQLLSLEYMNEYLRSLIAPSEQKSLGSELVTTLLKLIASNLSGVYRGLLEHAASSMEADREADREALRLYKEIEQLAADIDSGLAPAEERQKREEMGSLLRAYEELHMRRMLDSIQREGFSEEEARQFFARHPLMAPLTLLHKIVIVDHFKAYT